MAVMDAGWHLAGSPRRPARAEARRPVAGPAGRQMRRNTRVPLVPPKPKPLDMATSTFAWRAVLGT